jgi:hypothetical protein
MKYFLDFDRTIYDTESFKKAVAKRPPVLELLRQLKNAGLEVLHPGEGNRRGRSFLRTLGTFASHGRFAFTPEELRDFMYPDVAAFLESHDVTIVTYGVRAFITAKVTTALTDFPHLHIEYTSRKKGRTLRKLTKDEKEPCTFVDDKVFQLASVALWCPEIKCIEIRRDGGKGDGRWPVVHSLAELENVIPDSR